MIVEVWFVDCGISAAGEARYWSPLTDAERARAGRFRFEDDHRRSIVSRGALRQLLARFVEGNAEIDESEGKPRLRNSKIEFNVSHSGDVVAIAIAEFPVGIDVEQLRPLALDAGSIAKRHFSRAEVERISAAEDEEREFFSIWTAKEAVVKAAGKGLVLDLRSFTVPRDLTAFVPVNGMEEWSVRSLTAHRGGYEGALAIPSREAAAALLQVRLWPEESLSPR